MSRVIALCCLLSCLMLISVTAHAAGDIPGKPHLRVAHRDVAISAQTTTSLVKKVRPYAAMSELAYRAYSTPSPRKNVRSATPKQRAEGWGQLVTWLTKQQWEFFDHIEYPCGEKSHETLECDLWINKTTVPAQVVVAFRGADGDDSSDRDQYAPLHGPDFRSDVMDACRAAGKDVVVTATGHSFGGDLAQHLFYSSQLWPTNRVKEAIVFDPSPPTGWSEFPKDEERNAAMSLFDASLAGVKTRWKYPEVMAFQYGFGTIRVNESGEILSSLGALFRHVEPEESYISVLNLDFGEGWAVQRHNMARLAQNLLYYPSVPPLQIDLPPADDSGAKAEELYRVLNQT